MLSCRRLLTAFRELEITKTYPFARRLLFCQSPVLAHSKHSLRPRLAAITSRITRRGYGVMGFVREDRIQCVLVAINELNRPGKNKLSWLVSLPCAVRYPRHGIRPVGGDVHAISSTSERHGEHHPGKEKKRDHLRSCNFVFETGCDKQEGEKNPTHRSGVLFSGREDAINEEIHNQLDQPSCMGVMFRGGTMQWDHALKTT